MKKFLLKTLTFSALFISFTTIIWIISFLMIQKDSSFILDDVKTVFIGDSRIQRGVDDSMIANSINLSLQGEPYILIYSKLKKIISNNQNIKNVFLGFNELSLRDDVFNNRISIERKKGFLGKYLPISEELTYSTYFGSNKKLFLQIIPLVIKEALVMEARVLFGKNRISRYGRYSPTFNNEIEMKIPKTLLDESEYNITEIKYLEKILSLCEKKEINIYLLSTPVHKSYLSNPFIKKNIEILNSFYANELNGKYKWFNFLNFPLDDENFQDMGHLNFYGSKIFSEKLKKEFLAGQ